MVGNELADKFAQQALKATNVSIMCEISKSIIKKHVKKLWQDKWDRGDKGMGFYHRL